MVGVSSKTVVNNPIVNNQKICHHSGLADAGKE